MKKLKALLGNWLETLRAFPVAHGALLLLSLLTTLQIAYAGIFSDHSWEHWSYVLAFTLLLSLYGPLWELHFSQLKQGRFVSNLLQLIAVIGGVICYFYFLPQVKLGFSDQSFQLWGLFFVALIGIFFLLAYAYRTMETKTRFSYGMLIYALLFGGLAGVIIFGGIAGTFSSLELLFDLDIVSEVYGYLASWTLIFFTGSFVLNYYTFLIKTTFSKGDEFEYIPTRAEKVFGVWIFLPLTLLYLAIFLAYGLKIFFTWVWPRGVMVALGSGYFVGAMIAFFLTYSQKGRVFEWLYKILFASFVFVGLMMLGAIWQRIGQYGITIDRWLVVSWVIAVLGIGCAGLLKATKRFLITSGVLFVLGGVSFFGPFNAENLAFLSQKARLEALLVKYDKYFPLTSGSLVSFPQYSLEDSEEVAQILDYLIDYHGVRRLEWVLIDTIPDLNCSWRCSDEIGRYLGLDIKHAYEVDSAKYFYFNADVESLDIAGYTKLQEMRQKGYYENPRFSDSNIQILTLELAGETIELDFSPYFSQLETEELKPSSHKPFEFVDGDKKYVLTFASWKKEEDGKVIFDSFGGYVLRK